MTDVQTSTQPTEKPVFDNILDGADAILSRWEDADENQPSEDLAEEANEPLVDETELEPREEEEIDLEQEEAEEGEEDLESESEEQEELQELEITDDTEIEVLVDGKSHQVSLSNLKRLYGQEASLTRKSQETATQRKQAEEQLSKTNLVLSKMLERAEAKYKPYSEVDMLVASKSLSDEDFAQLRKEANDAETELKFLKEEADALYKDTQAQQQQKLQQAATEAVKVLQNDIPDWSNNLYNDIRTYAISEGLGEADVNSYVDPVVIKILNKARLYDQAKKVSTTKKKATAKKILRAKKAPQNDTQKKQKNMQAARERMRDSHDRDDIAEVILQRWES